ncbi:MAG: hypothetical protein Q7K65_01270 [Candidatus Buchananbacteria bacterium]|nr:hypothetical protein [Candidatus Buchananbacteria bacterium]
MDPSNPSPFTSPPQPDFNSTELSSMDYKDRQIHYEIKKRHWQRWVFYIILSVVFLSMTAYVVFVYNENVKLVNNITAANQSLKITTQSLSDSEKQSIERQRQISELEKSLADNQVVLDQKTADLQKATAEQTQLINKYQNFKVKLGSADANIYSFLINFSTGVSAADISKVPLAEYNFGGEDTDEDGLSNAIETALGTDINKKDTDGDTFSDKAEILSRYNPLGTGKLPINPVFSDLNKGLILIQVEQNKAAWYINPKDGKRYFLGSPAEVLQEIEKL